MMIQFLIVSGVMIVTAVAIYFLSSVATYLIFARYLVRVSPSHYLSYSPDSAWDRETRNWLVALGTCGLLFTCFVIFMESGGERLARNLLRGFLRAVETAANFVSHT